MLFRYFVWIVATILQRIACAKLIKRFVLHAKKTAFVVEHDFIMATYLADRVIVYDGEPGIEVRFFFLFFFFLPKKISVFHIPGILYLIYMVVVS